MHSFGNSDAPCLNGTLTFPSSVKDCPQIICDYRIPLDASGRPLSTAADIVVIFPYPTEKNATNGFASLLALRWGFTILSLRFPGMDREDGENSSLFYYYPQSGSGEAYRTAVGKVREVAGFPQRKLLLTGRSGGGSAAHLFANAYPDEVEAVAQEAGRIFPAEIKFHGPMLITHGECDYVLPNVLSFEAALLAAHANFTRISFRPNWGSRGESSLWTHGQYGKRGPEIIYKWLVDIANSRISNGGRLPPISTWSIERSKRFPGPLSLSAWSIMPSPRSIFDVHEGVASIARPIPKMSSRATIVILNNSFVESDQEAQFDGDQLADQGFVCIVSTSEATVRAAWDSLQAEEKKVPSFVIYYGANKNFSDLPIGTRHQCHGMLVFGRSKPDSNGERALAHIPGAIAWIDGRLLPEIPKGFILIPYKSGTNIGTNHSVRVKVISEYVTRLLAER